MFRKELAYYFSTPIAYIVIGLYLVAVSLMLWVIPGEWNIIDSGYADLRGMFQMSPWLLLLLCPALTMRLFAEEKQSGMWDLLRAKKVQVYRMVLAKYFAAWLLTLLAILPCIIHYVVVYRLAEPVGNVDGGQFAGSLIGLCFISMVFTALGLMTATLSRNQIVCYVLGVVLCFALYWITIQAHYQSISRGVVDVRDVGFLFGISAVALALTAFLARKIGTK
ncbi:MAG: gliding motility-associated ABC transporter permease subunit GldF [Paludibacteraceae bacterium]|nr:gliding motility-associated ABC transporter permease subunit GldF [Paludibacteraceae bacterium]